MDEISRFLTGWEKVRKNTTATAQDMPEEHYDASPFEGMWSFRKQAAHILNVGDILCEGLEQGQFDPSKFKLDNYGAKSKTELVAALEQNFIAQKQQLARRPDSFWQEPRKSFDGSDTTAGELLQMLKEHEIGHCNQLYLYLRSKGLVPPPTRMRAAAKAAKK